MSLLAADMKKRAVSRPFCWSATSYPIFVFWVWLPVVPPRGVAGFLGLRRRSDIPLYAGLHPGT